MPHILNIFLKMVLFHSNLLQIRPHFQAQIKIHINLIQIQYPKPYYDLLEIQFFLTRFFLYHIIL